MTRSLMKARFLVSGCLAISMTVFVGVAGAASLSDIAMMNGPDRQSMLEAGAKKEGEVAIYTTLIVKAGVRPLKALWEKKYPGIKFSYVRSSTGALVQKLLGESRAGKVGADVIMGSISDSMDQANMIAPFNSPEMTAYPKEYAGKDDLWFVYRLASFGMAYNSKILPEKDIPLRWEDLLNPNLKGHMVWKSSTSTGGEFLINHLQTIWGEKKSAKFFDDLAKQKVAKSNASLRAITDLVVAGEYRLLPFASLNHIVNSHAKGAPIWFSSPDPVPTRDDHVMLAKEADHPHSAMLLIDLILSEAGQRTMSDHELQVARPGVEPTKIQRPMIPQLNGRSVKIYSPQDFPRDKTKRLKAILKKISP